MTEFHLYKEGEHLGTYRTADEAIIDVRNIYEDWEEEQRKDPGPYGDQYFDWSMYSIDMTYLDGEDIRKIVKNLY